MSKRNDIIEPSEWTLDRKTGLVYSEILGWIDIGHAQGSDIKKLLSDIKRDESSRDGYYDVTYNCAVHKPYKGHLPSFMTWVQPWSDFTSGRVEIITVDGGYYSFLSR
ncbi:hypothetical protein R2X24_03630 [Citrobacter portucalensis]|nr:hypothetical protein [Citrobacter portucalensis]WOR32279.1 hypothetical protein R2X24_03630 [Citrobacter portucalensis]